ncbi:MAG: ISL3 family transposase [Roseomonas mucosa]|nr:ISL3 family transposase [Roseomonas mucosa]
MAPGFSFASLAPPSLRVDAVADHDGALIVTARSSAVTATCPLCGGSSGSVQSHYVRQPSDLPCAGRRVRLRLLVRRFRCGFESCRRQVFAERFGTGVLAERARRTGRLDELVHHLGLALGGRPGATFAQRLMLPVSNDTLLRVVRRRASPYAEPLAVVGIDDWAWRRNHRYGTVVCDLERRRVVALLPDREPATTETWLSQHPDIRVVSRDRGGGYGEAAARALPRAIQVADRWHLMENASAAFLDAVRLSMRAVRGVLGATTIDPALLTAAERLQHDGFLRREDTAQQILALKEAGHSIKEIVRRTRHSRRLVRQAVRGVPGDVFRVRQSSLDAYLPTLLAEWEAGCRNGAELWRRLRNQGFKGCSRVVAEWAARRRRAGLMQAQGRRKAPSARTLARLMTMPRAHLTMADTVTVAAVEAGVPALADAYRLVERFGAMIQTRAVGELEEWLEQARTSLIAPLARGIAKDTAAVRAAITEPWSNGQTEGQINRLKMIKRQMYGRAKLDLLEARLVGAG